MRDLSDTIAEPVRRLHHSAPGSREGRLINYSQNTDAVNNWHDDSGSSFDELDAEPLTIRVTQSGSAYAARGAGGIEVEGDAVVIVDPRDVTEIVTPGGGRPASQIVDPEGPAETRYEVAAVETPGDGLWYCQCNRIDD